MQPVAGGFGQGLDRQLGDGVVAVQDVRLRFLDNLPNLATGNVPLLEHLTHPLHVFRRRHQQHPLLRLG